MRASVDTLLYYRRLPPRSPFQDAFAGRLGLLLRGARVRPELPNGRSDDPFVAAPPGPTVPLAEFRCFHGLRCLLPNPFCGAAFVAVPPGRLRSRRRIRGLAKAVIYGIFGLAVTLRYDLHL